MNRLPPAPACRDPAGRGNHPKCTTQELRYTHGTNSSANLRTSSAGRLRLWTLLILIAALGAPLLPGSAQVLEVLHSFNGTDGSGPWATLTEASDGNFYGTTVNGSAAGSGTVFRLSPSGGFSTVYAFSSTFTNGLEPYAGLTEGKDGSLYGATGYGGPTNSDNWLGYGTLFKITTNGFLTTLVFLDDANGSNPYAEPVQASDGSFYGTTRDCCGSGNGYGTVFRMSPDGDLTTLFFFTDLRQGGDPGGPLIEAPDGAFYGMTVGGGPSSPYAPYGSGTVFKITTNGVLTRIAAFDGTTGRPYNMIRADDGNFYGTTFYPATIFKATPDGRLSVIAWLGGWYGDQPQGGLMQATDHFLYGTTANGGDYGEGNVFRISTDGVLEKVISFNGTNGSGPQSRLLQARDGNLYGTTYTGGANSLGTIFRIIMPGPRLNSFRAGQQLVLSWRTNYTGYQLESAVDLRSGTWSAVTNPPTLSGAQFFVTNSISAGAGFFRLKK
jgi:uncharacterized repeat protein (TIGR03803 family)